MPSRKLEKLYRPSVVAETLDVTEKTLENWRRLNKGPKFVRIGTGAQGVRYRESDLVQYMNDCDARAAVEREVRNGVD